MTIGGRTAKEMGQTEPRLNGTVWPIDLSYCTVSVNGRLWLKEPELAVTSKV